MSDLALQPRSPADLGALIGRLAAAPDSRAFFATLCQGLPQWLPDTRADLLVSDWGDGGMALPLVSDADAPAAPASAERDADTFAAWLRASGYRAVALQPLNAAGHPLGWLALARRHAPIDAEALGLAAQLAAVAALRLLHDRDRDEQAARDDTIAALERRLHSLEDLRLRATLAVGTAHDIGNMLAVVNGHAQMLQREAPGPLQPDLRAIVRAASDGHTLLRRLIALKSTPPAPALRQSVALAAVARDALDMTRPFWENRANLVVRTALQPDTYVQAHAVDMREIVINLIINAVAAMPTGGVLALRSCHDAANCYLEVSDTGQGIAAEYHGQIFQPSANTRDGARGLGLSMSRTLAESHGGRLSVESAPGRGATFTLELPLSHELALGSAVPAHAARIV